MNFAWHWRVPVEADLDVQIGLAIVLFAFIIHSLLFVQNYRWLHRANGSRPFIRAAVWSAGFFVALSGALLVSSSQQRTVNNSTYVEIPYIVIRLTLLVSPFVLWRLARDIDAALHNPNRKHDQIPPEE